MVQDGIYVATDTTGNEVRMCFEITGGYISNCFVVDYGNSLYIYGTVLSFSKNDLGGYTGSSSNITLTYYPCDTIQYYDLNTKYPADEINKANRKNNLRKDLITTDFVSTYYNPLSDLVSTTSTFVDSHTRDTITTTNFKIYLDTNHLLINATKKLEFKTTFFYTRDFYYNTTTSQIESLDTEYPFLNPLNESGVKLYCANKMTVYRNATLYPYYDTTNTGRIQAVRLYVESIRQIQE